MCCGARGVRGHAVAQWWGVIVRRWAPAVGGLAAAVLGLAGCGDAPLWDQAAGFVDYKDSGKILAVDDGVELSRHTGQVAGDDDYALFDVGVAAAGETWTFMVHTPAGSPRLFTIAVYDAEYDLLQRVRRASGVELRHTMRRATGRVYAAVMAECDGAVEFELVTTHLPAGDAPEPRAQVVWLDYTGARAIAIADQPAVSFGPFHAADLGPQYADATEVIKAEITRTVRALYAGYAVTIISSDEAAAPPGPHSTIYFGGYNPDLVGMGAGVDRYNADPSDDAIVYTRSFTSYAVMDLSPEDMGRMVGNTAAHELGHLLGLFHTRGADQLMDDARSAWDLAAVSKLGRAPLAETVFPFGVEDAPTVLAQTVGLAGD